MTKGAFEIKDGKVQGGNLQVVIAEHCVNRCVSCSAYAPFSKPAFADPDELAHTASILGKVYHPQVVGLVGGEPLLNPHFGRIGKSLRSSGLTDHVTLVTNGQLWRNIKTVEDWEGFDEVVLTVYPGKGVNVGEVVQSSGAHGKVVTVLGPRFAYSMTRVAHDAAETERLWLACSVGLTCMGLIRNQLWACYMAGSRNRVCGGGENDGLPIATGLTAKAIQEYFNRATWLDACRWCTGIRDRGACAWHEAATVEEWKARSAMERLQW